jgi:hypothetical protein
MVFPFLFFSARIFLYGPFSLSAYFYLSKISAAPLPENRGNNAENDTFFLVVDEKDLLLF